MARSNAGVGVPFTDWDKNLLNVSPYIDEIPREWLNSFTKQPLPFMEWMKGYLGYSLERTAFGFQRVIRTAACPAKNEVRNSYWYCSHDLSKTVCVHCWELFTETEKREYNLEFIRRGTTCDAVSSDVLEVPECEHSGGRSAVVCLTCHAPIWDGSYCAVCAANVALCTCGKKPRKRKQK